MTTGQSKLNPPLDARPYRVQFWNDFGQRWGALLIEGPNAGYLANWWPESRTWQPTRRATPGDLETLDRVLDRERGN